MMQAVHQGGTREAAQEMLLWFKLRRNAMLFIVYLAWGLTRLKNSVPGSEPRRFGCNVLLNRLFCLLLCCKVSLALVLKLAAETIREARKYAGSSKKYGARIRRHTSGQGSSWLAACTPESVDGEVKFECDNAGDALCIELSLWAKLARTEPYVR